MVVQSIKVTFIQDGRLKWSVWLFRDKEESVQVDEYIYLSKVLLSRW